jgi:phosphatidate cytidylyltransferase
VLTAAIALPLLILLILKGSLFLFNGFVLLLSLLGLIEFYRMALPERSGVGLFASSAGALLPLALLSSGSITLLPALTLMIITFGLIFLFSIRDIKTGGGEVALLFMGILYVPLLLGHLLLLRGLPYGIQWTFLLLVIVMAGDTGAYYVGSNFGRRKLYSIVSPNKSIEGAVGGLAGSVIGAFIAKATFFPGLTVFDSLATALLLGVFGQLGDLFESFLKRSFGVKDSGTIFPGHGGVLDRLDSILFAAPVAFYYACFVFMQR